MLTSTHTEMKNNGKKDGKENNMKKIFLAISCLSATFFMASCSSDMEETADNATHSFEELTFDVSVNGK